MTSLLNISLYTRLTCTYWQSSFQLLVCQLREWKIMAFSMSFSRSKNRTAWFHCGLSCVEFPSKMTRHQLSCDRDSLSLPTYLIYEAEISSFPFMKKMLILDSLCLRLGFNLAKRSHTLTLAATLLCEFHHLLKFHQDELIIGLQSTSVDSRGGKPIT